MAAATWVFGINWTSEASPDFSDTGEVVTTRVQNRDGVTMVRGRDTIRALAPPAAGSCDFTLNNASKDYSPDNASSPLYGKLLPGVPVRVTTTAPSATNIWRGYLDDLPQMPLLRGGFVRVPCLGTLAKLKGVKISSNVYASITTSAAFAHVCRLAGLAAAEYQALDTGKTVLSLWWCGQDDAFDMMCRILAAEGPGAAIYEDGQGRVTFHSRHYRLLTARCTTSQVTFGNGTTEPKHSPPFGYQPNLKGVVNSAAFETKVPTLGGSATVWSWTGSINLAGPSQFIYFDVVLTQPAVNFGAVITSTPPDGVSIDVLNEGSPGGNGSHIRLKLYGLPSVDQLYTITAVTVSAQSYTAASETVANSADTSTSQGKYGTRTLPTNYNPWPYLDPNVARDFANAIVGAYSEPRASIDVTVNNGHATRLTHQLAREISDRVTVQESQTGINGDVYIERIRHEVKEGGKFHATTFSCEKSTAAINYLIWDTGVWDTAQWGY